MKRIEVARAFERDVVRMRKRNKDLTKLESVMRLLLAGETVPRSFHDHALLGKFKDCRELHIEPDWLLLYHPTPDGECIRFARTGTHADLFR